MSATEVTFDQYDSYCKESGANLPDDNGWGRSNRPVIKVSWDDAMGFCKWNFQSAKYCFIYVAWMDIHSFASNDFG